MRQPFVTVAFPLSLLLCAAMAALWLTSNHDDSRAGRGIAASAPSAKVALATSSPATSPIYLSAVHEVAAIVPQIANDQLHWGVWREVDGSLGAEMNEPAELSGPADKLDGICHDYAGFDRRSGISPKRLARPLLRALDSPDQFVVAHLILTHLFKTSRVTVEERHDGQFVENVDGLRILLTPQGDGVYGSPGRTVYDCTATIDPSQMVQIKRQWLHRVAQQDGPSE